MESTANEVATPATKAAPARSKPAKKKQKLAYKAAEPSRASKRTAKAPPKESPARTLGKAPAIWAKVKGRRGHLKMVVEMPFDILLEIFQHLDPLDLLNLTWSSRDMRNLMLDRSVASSLWQASLARSHPTPPPCPEDLSPPQYAALLFVRTCSLCNAPHGVKPYWLSYARLCNDCVKTTFVEEYTSDQVKTPIHNICDITPSAWLPSPNFSYAGHKNLYYRPQCERHLSVLERLEKKDGGDSNEVDEYMKRQRTLWDARIDLGRRLCTWNWALTTAKKTEKERSALNRQTDFTNRIEDLGFGDVLKHLNKSSIATLPGVKGTQRLTEKAWSKIEPLLVDTLTELRKTFTKRERAMAVGIRTVHLHRVLEYFKSHNRELEHSMPTAGQFALSEPFRTLVYDKLPGDNVGESDFLKLLDSIPAVLESWKEKADSHLTGLLPSTTPAEAKTARKSGSKGKEKEPDFSTLRRATTMFSCQWCTEILLYPTVLTHQCFYMKHGPSFKRNWETPSDDDEQEDEEDDEEDDSYPQGPYNLAWNACGNQIRFDDASSDFAKPIIEALGHDPATATWDELDDAGGRVECVRCRTNASRLVMDWRCAIVHEHEKHAADEDEDLDSYKTAWKALGPHCLELAQAKANAARSHRKRYRRVPRCCQCGEGKIVDGTVRVPYMGFGVDPDALTCSQGHDLKSGKGVYYFPPTTFHHQIGSVKIPLESDI